MIEYRLENLPKVLEETLNEIGAFIATEEFAGETTYLVYASEDISDILAAFGAKFVSHDTSDTGWDEKWKDYIKEGYLTNSLYYIFEPKTFDDGRKTIFINPSLAFGTGTHPTTQIAAQLFELIIKDKTLLDVGTGSGILAIAASKLGAKQVDAFDIDPQALPNCLENIKNNDCHNIKAWSGEISDIKKGIKYDVVSANIISSVLLMLNDKIYDIASEYIIYSGILKSEYDEVQKLLLKENYEVDEFLSINEWCGVRIKKKSK